MHRASARASEGAFVAEGTKVVAAALGSGAAVESLYLAPEAERQEAIGELVARALDGGARVFELGPGLMEKVADAVTPQPVCAVVEMLDRPLAELLSAGGRSGNRLVLCCVDVRDPGNLGAIIRSAGAAGADGLVWCTGTADPYSPKTVRASAGSLFELPLADGGGADEALAAISAAGFKTVATTARGGTDYATAALEGDIALVLGNEASGLPDELASRLDERVSIPMAGRTESLNVAMTATILCHEIARRRRLH